MECGLWGPALILARAAGDGSYAETAAAMAVATAGPGSPLFSLLLMLAGGHELVLPAKPSARSSPAKAASGSSFNLKGLLNKTTSKVSLDKQQAALRHDVQCQQSSLQLSFDAEPRLTCGGSLPNVRHALQPA